MPLTVPRIYLSALWLPCLLKVTQSPGTRAGHLTLVSRAKLLPWGSGIVTIEAAIFWLPSTQSSRESWSAEEEGKERSKDGEKDLKAFYFVVPGFLKTGYFPAVGIYKAIPQSQNKFPIFAYTGSGDSHSNLESLCTRSHHLIKFSGMPVRTASGLHSVFTCWLS